MDHRCVWISHWLASRCRCPPPSQCLSPVPVPCCFRLPCFVYCNWPTALPRLTLVSYRVYMRLPLPIFLSWSLCVWSCCCPMFADSCYGCRLLLPTLVIYLLCFCPFIACLFLVFFLSVNKVTFCDPRRGLSVLHNVHLYQDEDPNKMRVNASVVCRAHPIKKMNENDAAGYRYCKTEFKYHNNMIAMQLRISMDSPNNVTLIREDCKIRPYM